MRHAAIRFAQKAREELSAGNDFDVVLSTDMLNLAEFRGLAPIEVSQLPQVLYFHENQFAYPSQVGQERDFHFSFTNLVSAIAADEIWFNSEFNRDSMLQELKTRMKRFPDFAPKTEIASLDSKMVIEEPGIDLDGAVFLGKKPNAEGPRPIRIVWAARWEHDKNPADLLLALRLLKEANVEFQISVIGQRYSRCPEEFDLIETEFADCIWRWGYQASRDQYWETLRGSDIFLSTAHHEFFGLSAVEAISAGCYPLLPNRLAYPEVISKLGADGDQHLYRAVDDDLTDRVEKLVEDRDRIKGDNIASEFLQLADAVRSKFGWPIRAKEMDQRLASIASRTG